MSVAAMPMFLQAIKCVGRIKCARPMAAQPYECLQACSCPCRAVARVGSAKTASEKHTHSNMKQNGPRWHTPGHLASAVAFAEQPLYRKLRCGYADCNTKNGMDPAHPAAVKTGSVDRLMCKQGRWAAILYSSNPVQQQLY